MTALLPEYVGIPAERLGEGHGVRVSITADAHTLAREMAEEMARVIRAAQSEGRGATLIVPVGPVDQFPMLAELLNRERLSCRETVFINMDEYLTDDDRWIAEDHPLSFRGYMQRKFYDLIEPELAPPAERRVFPDPSRPEAIGELIQRRGGVDACFGGIGINGHIAFNEPPEQAGGGLSPASDEVETETIGVEESESVSSEEFTALPTRVLSLARETRTINSVTVGGELSIIPRRAVTVGMREILASRSLRFYCNRPWQRAVVRRVLHGAIEAACPASFLRTHPDAAITVTEEVARLPEIRLR